MKGDIIHSLNSLNVLLPIVLPIKCSTNHPLSRDPKTDEIHHASPSNGFYKLINE